MMTGAVHDKEYYKKNYEFYKTAYLTKLSEAKKVKERER